MGKINLDDLMPKYEKSDFEKKIEEADRLAMEQKRAMNQNRRFVARTDEEKEIARSIKIIDNGEKCEDDVRYALSYLPRDTFRVFYNVYIRGVNEIGEPETQEHDAIVVCNNAIFDIEAKSINGDLLTIHQDGQWTVRSGRKYYAIPNPEAQVLRHYKNIKHKVEKYKIPIIELVVTNNDRLLIKNDNSKTQFDIVKTDSLIGYINERAGNAEKLNGVAIMVSHELC